MADHEYNTDLVLWAQDQARALRNAAGVASNLPVDWDNVAEEIETLGKSQSRELASRISTVLIHLLKLKVSPATEPRVAWRETIREQRDGIKRVLADAPSLRRTIPTVIQEELAGARQRVQDALADYDEQSGIDLAEVTFAEDQVIERWFPEPPAR
jgi:Domain of unknown function DUF29